MKGTESSSAESEASGNRIECHRCGDPIEDWCETRRYGFWDEDAQNYERQPIEDRYCRECWQSREGRANGAHFHPTSSEQLFDILDAADGDLAAVLCWWTGRPAVRVVDGEPEAAVTKPHDGGTKPDGTPILKFESERIEDFDVGRFHETAAVPENEDRALALLRDPEDTALAGVDGEEVATDGGQDTITVEIYRGRSNVDEHDEPAETVEIPAGESVVWQDDPYYSSPPLGFSIAEGDRPSTLYVYTNDSVRTPHKDDFAEWDGPIERGLPFPADSDERRPYGCEVWGRVLFYVEEGLTR